MLMTLPAAGRHLDAHHLATRHPLGAGQQQDRRTGEEVGDDQVDSVDRPRKKAKPRTEPTVRYHSTRAPISDTMSATTMVCHAPAKPRWALLRIDRPARTSSFNRSKNTTYESTVTPTDTMRPAMPASDRARPCVFDRNEMTVQINAPETARPTDDDQAEQAVVQHHEDQDQADADEAGDPRGAQRVLAERRRHGLHRLGLQLTGSEPLLSTRARLLASPSLKLPVICTLPVKFGCCTVGAEITSPSSSIAN